MAQQSIQAINLCKNADCSLTEDDEHTEKCSLCDGYFADDGLNDCYILDDALSAEIAEIVAMFDAHSDQANLVK